MSWADDLDLLGPRTRLWRGSWGLLVAGALAVVVTEREHARLLADQAQAEAQAQQVQRLQRRLARDAAAPGAAPAESGRSAPASQARAGVEAGAQRGAGAGSRTSAAEADRDTAAALQQARALIQRLAHPWGAVLGGVEAGVAQVAADGPAPSGPAPAVALLSLAHEVPESGAAQITLEAAVADDATAWRLVEALDASPAFDDVLLLSRETLAQAPGGLPLRVRLLARLRPGTDEADAMEAVR
ncbi:MAG: hypothetical protein ACOZD0_01620 [Pseudomonadota bacterium]